jgi:hypothetical protein
MPLQCSGGWGRTLASSTAVSWHHTSSYQLRSSCPSQHPAATLPFTPTPTTPLPLPSPTHTCNLYCLHTHRSEYLSKFIPPPSPSVPSVCSTLVERAAGRLLMLWVRSACLLRPLGPQGKLQLAKDLGELQMVVGQGLFPLDALGPAHRCVVLYMCRV